MAFVEKLAVRSQIRHLDFVRLAAAGVGFVKIIGRDNDRLDAVLTQGEGFLDRKHDERIGRNGIGAWCEARMLPYPVDRAHHFVESAQRERQGAGRLFQARDLFVRFGIGRQMRLRGRGVITESLEARVQLDNVRRYPPHGFVSHRERVGGVWILADVGAESNQFVPDLLVLARNVAVEEWQTPRIVFAKQSNAFLRVSRQFPLEDGTRLQFGLSTRRPDSCGGVRAEGRVEFPEVARRNSFGIHYPTLAHRMAVP